MERKLIFILILLFIPFVSSVPPVTTVDEFPEGYLITEQQQGSILYNQDYNYNFFVQNASNGIEITDATVTCTFFLANISGDILYSTNATYYDFYNGYWRVELDAGNFSYIGEYPYGLLCKNGDLGGGLSGTFYAGYSGKILDSGEAILYIPLFLVFFFAFFMITFGINYLPSENQKDSDNRILKISYLKYLRSTLYFILWLLVLAVLYLASNLSFAYSPDVLLANFFLMLYKIGLGLTLPIVVIWLLWILSKITEDKQLNSMMKRGLFNNQNL